MLELLQDKIERGVYPTGQRLPSERILASEYGVPQSQIHKKLQELVREGFLECFRSNGYFVRAGKPSSEKLNRVAFCWESKNNYKLTENFYTDMLLGMANDYSLNLNVFSMPESPKAQNSLFMQLINEGYKGIFAFPHFFSEFLPSFIELKKLKIPMIFWDYSPFPAIFPAVGVDHFLSCFNASEIFSKINMPVTYIGYGDFEQNILKFKGFDAGCKAYGIKMDSPIIIPYNDAIAGGRCREYFSELKPGKLYFTSTRNLTEYFMGKMFDDGYYPGKDYLLLGTDRLQFMEGSSFQLDCMMRDQSQIVRKLLLEMKHAIQKSTFLCNDYRIPMQYIQGSTLHYKQD